MKLYKFLVMILSPFFAFCGCARKATEEPGYIIQVSLGGWSHADYSADEVIGRVDSVARLIPVEKVIIGWTRNRETYRKVGEHLHAKGIRMLLWLPVFAETEDVCDNSPAVDLWGEVPAHYNLAAGTVSATAGSTGCFWTGYGPSLSWAE